jgi:hypothetical protein
MQVGKESDIIDGDSLFKLSRDMVFQLLIYHTMACVGARRRNWQEGVPETGKADAWCDCRGGWPMVPPEKSCERHVLYPFPFASFEVDMGFRHLS